jgi:oligosaccharyltransferase complex subunit gamma
MLSVKHLSFLFLLCSSSLARTFSDSRLEADFKKLTALAAANDGVVKLDSALYDVITAKDREWSVAVQLTALGKEFKCAPCK